jgi:hypothetical protein
MKAHVYIIKEVVEQEIDLKRYIKISKNYIVDEGFRHKIRY